jgi:hypothetical protein
MKKYPVDWCAHLVNVPGIHFKRYNTETAFQIYCADWLRKQYQLTQHRKFKDWHHSANERACAHSGLIAKLMGQAKGIPDFIQFEYKIAVELKMPGRALSPEQRRWLKYLNEIGWTAKKIDSFERFKKLVLGLE